MFHYTRARRGIPLDAPGGNSRRILTKTETHKQCGRCDQVLPLDVFGIRKNGVHVYSCASCVRWHTIEKRYGLTRTQWMDIYNQQSGRCAICRKHFPDTPGKHVGTDHCHTTGAVRGILCAACNSALACVERVGLKAFEDYLR